MNRRNEFEFYYELVTRPLSDLASSDPSDHSSDHINDENNNYAFDNDEYNLFVLNKPSDEVLHPQPGSRSLLFKHDDPCLQSKLITEPAEKETTNQPIPTIPAVLNPDSEYYYYYSSWEKCHEIFTKRCIHLEKLFHGKELVEGIILLTVPPTSSDTDILLEYFGPNVPVDKKQIECYIQLRREILDKSQQFIVQIGPNKFLCKRKIQFQSRLPKHEFRSKYQFS